MNLKNFVGFFASTVLLSSVASAEIQNDIPLDQIWAVRMPGTRDIQKLSSAKEPLVLEIRRSLAFPPEEKVADPGFAVSGTGLQALREAHAILVQKKPRRDKLRADKVSIVFFTYETSPYVHIDEVQRTGKNFDIYYKFVYHETEDSEVYVAMIPLGRLSAGDYSVNIKRSPKERRILRRVGDFDASRIVCQSFTFTISE